MKQLPAAIRGDRVCLKKLEVHLARKMFDYIAEDRERLSRFLPWPIHIKTVDDEVDFINKSSEGWEKGELANFGIFRNEDDEYMGNVGVFNLDWKNESCEIGYWILGKFEGRGFVSEAVTLLERELFGAGMNRIVIMCEPGNERSRNIPRNLGYRLDGVLREFKKSNERYVSLEVYSKLRKDLPDAKQ